MICDKDDCLAQATYFRENKTIPEKHYFCEKHAKKDSEWFYTNDYNVTYYKIKE